MVDHSTDSEAQERQLNLAFQALSDPSRRKIIGLLREAESLTVSEIAQAFSMSLNGVSKHLKVLERAGLVSRNVISREHWLSVDWQGVQRPYNWLHFYRNFWDQRLELLADYFHEKGPQDE